MFNEAGVLIDKSGQPIYWHVPRGRTSTHLPDSRELWDVIWANRDKLGGFAHTHPGDHPPTPSQEDITTFSAIELGLGKRLEWWIATDSKQPYLCRVVWCGPAKYDYVTEQVTQRPMPWSWLFFLLVLSRWIERGPQFGDVWMHVPLTPAEEALVDEAAKDRGEPF